MASSHSYAHFYTSSFLRFSFLCVNAPHGPERRALQHCITQSNNDQIQSDYSQGKREKMIFTDRSSRLTQHRSITWHRHNNHDGQKPLGGKHTDTQTKQGITRSPARWGSGVERDKKCLLYSPPSASKNHPQGQNGPCHCPYQPVSGHAHCAEEIGGIQKRKCKLKPQAENAYAYGEAQFEEVVCMWLRVYIWVSLQLMCYCCLCGTKIRLGSITNPWDPRLQRWVVLSVGRACCSLSRPRWCRRCMWLHYCTPENKG